MDCTLFTSAMIETFRVCRRAYQYAFGVEPVDKIRLSALCKRFLVRAVGEIHRGRLQGLPQAQRYLGENWPSERLAASGEIEQQEAAVEAFRFVYRALTSYVSSPYKPRGSEVVGVNQKARARVPYLKVYLEEVFDLLLFHPSTATLEIVDFHLGALKPFDPAWPAVSLLVRYYVAQRLKSRWPFRKIVFTMCRLHANGVTPISIELDESLFRLHWPEVLKTLEEMKNPRDFAPHAGPDCKRCKFFHECQSIEQRQEPEHADDISLTA